MAIEQAHADLQRLTTEAERLRSKISDVAAQIAKIRIYLEMAHVYGGDAASLIDGDASPKIGRPVGSGSEGRKVDAAVSAITAKGGPISTRELIAILNGHGIEIAGSDPFVNLSSTLSRSNRLKNRRAVGWSLAEWPSDYAPIDTPNVGAHSDTTDDAAALEAFEKSIVELKADARPF